MLINKNELFEVKEVLNKCFDGSKIIELEKLVSDYFGMKYAICTSSKFTALHLATIGLTLHNPLGVMSDIGEVLISDYNFQEPVFAIRHVNGIREVFVDIDSKTYNMHYRDLRKKIKKRKTNFIVVTHMFGQSADMNKIMKIANKKNIPVLEDVTNALGAKFKGSFCGTIGEAGCFTIGNCGMIVTNNDEINSTIRDYMSMKKEVFDKVIYDYQPSELEAAVAISQFRKNEKIIKKRNALARYWNKKLKEIDYITKPYIRKGKGNVHTYSNYCCQTTYAVDRNKLIQLLKEKGISVSSGAYCSHIQPCYHIEENDYNQTMDVWNRSIILPLSYETKKSEIDSIIEVLKEINNQVFI